VRVAALYDIHGNLAALDAVLAEVEREDVDAVVVGGDVVGGPFPGQVFDRLTGLPDVRFLRGNADRMVVEGDAEFGIDWSSERDRTLRTGLRVVDAGSVGMPYEGRRGAFWALLGPTVELRHTAYDVEAAAASIDDEQHSGSLLDPPDPDETTRYFESQRGA
jgi:hypothetical protein